MPVFLRWPVAATGAWREEDIGLTGDEGKRFRWRKKGVTAKKGNHFVMDEKRRDAVIERRGLECLPCSTLCC